MTTIKRTVNTYKLIGRKAGKSFWNLYGIKNFIGISVLTASQEEKFSELQDPVEKEQFLLSNIIVDQDVMLGYINGDSVLPYLNDTRLAWSHMLAASAIDSRYYQLYTPLVNTKKYQILEQIPSRLLKLVTWCEGTQTEDDCGSCPSCMSMQVAYEEYRIRNRVNKLCQEFKERMKVMAVKRKLSQNPKISNVRLQLERK